MSTLDRVNEERVTPLPASRNLHESLSRAEFLAARRKHTIVGLDHLLLALGQDTDALAIMLACKVHVEALCMDLLRKLGPEAKALSPNTIPPTLDITVQNLLAHASAAASAAGQTEIDGANILSAIISGEGGQITNKILVQHGLTYEDALKILNERQPQAAPQKEKSEQSHRPSQQSGQQGQKTPLQQTASKANSEQKQSKQKISFKTGPKKQSAALAQKASGPQEGDVFEDTIIQAEAHPSDYDLSSEGDKARPAPPPASKNARPSKQKTKAQPQTRKKTSPQREAADQGAATSEKPQKKELPETATQPPLPGQEGDRYQASVQAASENKVAKEVKNSHQGAHIQEAHSQGTPPQQRAPMVRAAEKGAPLQAPPPPPLQPGENPAPPQLTPVAMPQIVSGQPHHAPGRQAELPSPPRPPAGRPHPPHLDPQSGQFALNGQYPAPLGSLEEQKAFENVGASMKHHAQELRQTGSDDLVIENVPKVMRVGKMHYVEVCVARFASAELDFGPENYGLRAKEDKQPKTKAITVRLTGADTQFLIEASTATTQWTEMNNGVMDEADFAIWRWRVMPRKSGKANLRLDVSVRSSGEEGLGAEIPVQPSKSFNIKVTPNYLKGVKRGLLIALIFGCGFAIAKYGQTVFNEAQTIIEQMLNDQE